MAGHHPIPELDRKGLRSFGATTGGIVAALFGLLLPWLLDRDWPLWPWLVAGPLWLLALAWPGALRMVYRGWMQFGLLASRITTPLILGVVFYLVVTPLAFVQRIRSRDALFREFDSSTDSYRVASHKNPVDRLERPF
jgi:hypothetical protein